MNFSGSTSIEAGSPGARIVLCRIAAGQEVPSHTSPSTVVLTVVSGSGIVSGAEGDRAVCAGDIVAYEPDEPHGMGAADEPLVLAAMIAPRSADVGSR